MKTFFRAAILAALLLPPLARAAPPPRPTLSAPVMVDQETVGETWVYKSADGIRVDSLLLQNALENALNPEAFGRFRTGTAGKSLIALSELAPFGFEMFFEEATLTLRLRIPEASRRRREFALRGYSSSPAQVVGPESFSGYLNASVLDTFEYPRAKVRQPFQGKLGLATNWQGVVLESGAVYTEKENYQWRREDTRLVKDFESKLIRTSLGDIPVNTSGYQNARPLGGVALTRQYAIQPYLNTRPLNRTELWLKSPSTIEVFVNDGFVQRFQAAAGPVQLSDFPLFSGLNKVDLKVIDGTGKVEWVNLNLLYDSQLLGQGMQEFGYHFGAPAEEFLGDRRYRRDNLTFSGYHRVGWNDRLTLGASFQADRFSWLAGHDMVLLTKLGLWSGDFALSRRNGGFTAGAGRVRLKSLDYKMGSDKPLRGAAEVEYLARSFAALGANTAATNSYSWRYDLSVSKPLTPVTSAGLGFQYQVSRLGTPNRRAARLDFASELHPQWRVAMNYGLEREQKWGHRFQITFTWVEETGKYYGNLSHDYPGKTTRLEMSRNPSATVDDFRAVVGVQNAPAAARADALLEYTHEKALVRAEHASFHERNGPGLRRERHATTLSLSTALAWAGPHVAITRPIADSFALIHARPAYRKFDVPVNPLRDSAEAIVNRIGPAVVPTLTAYNETPIVLDGANLPVGYSLGNEYRIARPTYRSGVRVEIGSESTAVIASRALKADGTPVSLATGKATEKSSGSGKAFSFFTNREGVFVLEGLTPGNYELTLDEGDFAPVALQLAPEQAGFLRLAPVTFAPPPDRGTP